MIQAGDLRIGNWYKKIDGYFPPHKEAVYSARYYQIKAEDIPNIEYNNDPTYHPIPLTPEILKKCEFEFPSNTLTLNDDWFLYDNYDGFWLQVEKQGEAGYICERFKIECKYLHQLQNLIYCLTNSEIKINL